MIKGKTPEEIRRTFNIKNDFTPQEVSFSLIYELNRIKYFSFVFTGRTNQKRERMVRRKMK